MHRVVQSKEYMRAIEETQRVHLLQNSYIAILCDSSVPDYPHGLGARLHGGSIVPNRESFLVINSFRSFAKFHLYADRGMAVGSHGIKIQFGFADSENLCLAGGFMKKHICAMISLAALFPVARTSAQHRGLPANVPPNPNYVVTDWGQLPDGKNWKDMKAVDSVTFDPNGKGSIVVLVTPPVPTDPSVLVFDFDGKLQRSWGAGMFVRPYDMVVDRFGYLWIIDNTQNFVAKFTEDGKQLLMVGKKGVAGDNTSHDLFSGPTDVAVAKNGDFFVTDGYINSRIVKFDKNGKFLMIIGGTKGADIGQFNLPHRVFIDSKNELVMMDRVNKRIQFWTLDGKFIKQWTDLDFMYPSGMAMAPDGTFYFSDSDGQSVKIVKDDKILDAFGGLDGMRPHQIAIDHSGAMYLVDEPFRIVKKVVKKSSLNSQLTTQP